MATGMRRQFPHRHNTNGGHDAICAVCYVTVASRDVEGDLMRLEASHVRDPGRLFELRTRSAPIGKIVGRLIEEPWRNVLSG